MVDAEFAAEICRRKGTVADAGKMDRQIQNLGEEEEDDDEVSTYVMPNQGLH
jgi:hypothetical protein